MPALRVQKQLDVGARHAERDGHGCGDIGHGKELRQGRVGSGSTNNIIKKGRMKADLRVEEKAEQPVTRFLRI